MRTNISMESLKKKLNDNKFVLGTWCEIPSPEFINVLAKAGMDFVIIDMEHGAIDITTASKMIMAAEADGCSPLIRVSRNDEITILKALEIAPQGIIVPHIESIADRKKAVSNTKFSPQGKRSLNPFTRAGGYHSYSSYTDDQNKNILLSLLIESKNGINDIDKIIDENIDLIYIGTYDISLALGIPGDVSNKKVTTVIEKIVKAIRKKGKAAGCMFHNEQELIYFKKIGIQFLCYKVDTAVVYDEFHRVKTLL